MLRTVRLRLPGGIPKEGLVAFWELMDGSGQVAYSTRGALNNMQLGSLPIIDINDPSWISSTGGLSFVTDDYCIQSVLGIRLGTVRASMYATNSFLEDLSQDFSSFQAPTGSNRNFILVATDSTGLKAMGYIGERGRGETFGSDILSGWNFLSGWTTTLATILSSNSFITTADNGGVYRVGLMTTGKLYRIIINSSSDIGDVKITPTSDALFNITKGTGTQIGYYSAMYPGIVIRATLTAETVTVSSLELKEVLTPGVNGVYIYSTPTGDVKSWAQIQTGFSGATLTSYAIYRSDLNFRG